MMRLYPQLSARPTVSEQVRRLAVQGDTAAGEQKYDQALTLYARAVGAAPWWPKARYNLALLKAQRDNFPGAIAEMQQYLELAPGAPDIRVAQDLIYQWQYKQQSAGKQ
jgi:tetratricopeptide (TPR) repeat protein